MALAKKEIIYLIRQYYRIQEHRIAFGGQIRALREQKLNTNPLDLYFARLKELEKEIANYIKKSIEKVPIWTEYLGKIRGIGPIIAAGLINLIDIRKARHISSLWKFAGLAPGQRLIRGKPTDFNPLMKTLCWKIGRSFLMTDSPYRKYYDQRKEYEMKKHPELRKFHIDRRARRYMVKMFLKDLWLHWRGLENLPLSRPYVIERLGHKENPKLYL